MNEAAKVVEVVFGSKPTDEWRTPQYFYDALNAKYHFVYDLAASAANAKCPLFSTKERSALGEDPWPCHGWIWCNPPYSKPNLSSFTARARAEVSDTRRGRCCRVAMLVPATPGAAWFQDNVLGGADLLNFFSIDRGPLAGKVLQLSARECRIEVNFLRGRLAFEGGEGTAAKTDSALVRYFPRGVNW